MTFRSRFLREAAVVLLAVAGVLALGAGKRDGQASRTSSSETLKAETPPRRISSAREEARRTPIAPSPRSSSSGKLSAAQLAQAPVAPAVRLQERGGRGGSAPAPGFSDADPNASAVPVPHDAAGRPTARRSTLAAGSAQPARQTSAEVTGTSATLSNPTASGNDAVDADLHATARPVDHPGFTYEEELLRTKWGWAAFNRIQRASDWQHDAEQ